MLKLLHPKELKSPKRKRRGPKVHFMGIEGAGLSAVAKIAASYGFEVSGCDLKATGHDISHLKDIDILAVTPAVYFQSAQHPELIEGRRRGILMTWQEFMGKYLHSGKFVICIAGTHGKSTTTAMAGQLLQAAGLDPTVEIGADGSRFGTGKYFVSEADEYYGNFLHYHPDIVILNNIELDHPEYFGTFEKMLEIYAQFLSQIKPDGTLIYNIENLGIKKLISNFKFHSRSARTFSISNFVPYSINEFPKNLTLKIPGEHNKANAMGIIKLAEVLKINHELTNQSLTNFRGIGRRLEELGTINGITVIDDYANHPTAFTANISAVKEKYPERDIWAVIEPHTFSRLRAVLPDLAPALKGAGHIIISKIFASRETDPGDFTGADIAKSVPNSLYIPKFEQIIEHLKLKTKNRDVVLVMGSGNSDKLAREILDNL